MYGWEQIIAEYPFLRNIWDSLAIILPLSALMAYAGIYFISAVARIFSIVRRRSAYDKCSRQVAFLGLFLGWGLLAGSRIWLYYTAQQHQPGTLETFLLEMSWLILSVGVLLSSIYYCLWRILRNMPVLHSTIGMISGVTNCLAFALILTTLRVGAKAPEVDNGALALPEFFIHSWLDDPLWSAACYSLPLIFSMPAATSACWLALRRARDDFGRDYYNAMIPWLCGWARNAWSVLWLLLLASTGLQIWQQWQTEGFDWMSAVLDADRILIWLIPILLWIAVIRSKIPLRRSWMLFAALILCCFFMIPYYFELMNV